MRKRPLCAICVLFLIIQTFRVCFSGVEGQQPSELEKRIGDGTEVSFTGTVYRMEKKEKVTAVFLKNNAVSLPDAEVRESKILVYIKHNQKKTQLKIGSRVAVTGEAQPFESARNPGNFDQKSSYRKMGIHVLVWAEKTGILSAEYDHVRQFLQDLKSRWNELLNKHLGEYYGGTMGAILLGEKGGLDPEMKKAYQKNGISHLLAISGLHMSFIGMGVYQLMRRAGAGFAVSGITGGGILILYALMIGAGVSSQRALIMFLVRMGAEITGRDYDLPTSLALSAAVLCAREPLYLTDAGFQLSYGALLGIAAAGPVFYEMLGCRKVKRMLEQNRQKLEHGGVKRKEKAGLIRQRGILKASAWILSGLSASLAVNLILLGPLLYFYYEVPPYSVFLNLLVIPVMPVVMGAGLAGSALCLIWENAGAFLLNACRIVLWSYDAVCETAGMLPGSRFVTGQPGVVWLAFYYSVLAAGLLLFYGLKNCRERREEQAEGEERQWQSAGYPAGAAVCTAGRAGTGILLFVFAAVMAVCCRAVCRGGPVSVTVLDVGQGDGIHIRGESGDYLIDGGSSDISMVGTYRIEPYLLANAADTLDYVFATHGDEDHINGIRELLEGQKLGIRIRNLVLPPEQYHDEKLTSLARIAAENDTRILVMKPGDEIVDQTGGEWFRLKCLGPDRSVSEPGNGASLVLSMEYGAFDMLFTGDLEGQGEESLLEGALTGPYDVLKAAHHGSREANSEAFIEAVSPRVSVISAGVDNRYGHPHPETLERLRAAGSRIYSTAQQGAVRIETDGETMAVRRFPLVKEGKIPL